MEHKFRLLGEGLPSCRFADNAILDRDGTHEGVEDSEVTIKACWQELRDRVLIRRIGRLEAADREVGFGTQRQTLNAETLHDQHCARRYAASTANRTCSGTITSSLHRPG
jgi:hypothetical protein